MTSGLATYTYAFTYTYVNIYLTGFIGTQGSTQWQVPIDPLLTPVLWILNHPVPTAWLSIMPTEKINYPGLGLNLRPHSKCHPCALDTQQPATHPLIGQCLGCVWVLALTLSPLGFKWPRWLEARQKASEHVFANPARKTESVKWLPNYTWHELFIIYQE